MATYLRWSRSLIRRGSGNASAVLSIVKGAGSRPSFPCLRLGRRLRQCRGLLRFVRVLIYGNSPGRPKALQSHPKTLLDPRRIVRRQFFLLPKAAMRPESGLVRTAESFDLREPSIAPAKVRASLTNWTPDVEGSSALVISARISSCTQKIQLLATPFVDGCYCSSAFCLLALAASAYSISRRIASEREGLSFCCLAQLSILDLSADGSRTVRIGSCPVGGRPRFLCVTGIDISHNLYYMKVEPAESGNFPPTLTQAKEEPMAQADYVSIATRALITGVGAKPSTNPVRAAHAEFVAAVAGHPPCPIPIYADASDIEDRADHLKTVLNVLSVYVTALLDDTAQNLPGGLDLRQVDALLSDLTSEVGGTLQQAAEDLERRAA